MNESDLKKIEQRQSVDELKYLHGSGLANEPGEWDWQNKYHLEFSIPSKPEEFDVAHAKGMLRKEQLRDGRCYWGICRNARVARWSAEHQLFFHQRKKFEHWYVESIPHPIDQKTTELFGKVVGFDIFVPWVEVEPLDFERI